MLKINKDINTDSRMYNNATETMEDLFLYCPVAQAFVFASPMNLRLDENLNLSVLHYIKSWLLEGGDHSKLKLGACLFWTLWKTRNNIIFNKGSIKLQTMLQEGLFWFSQDILVQDVTAIPTGQDLLSSATTVWSPPPPVKFKINFDGASGCQSKILEFLSPVEAEAYGALEGVDLARSKGFNDIIIEGDSLIVINALRYNISPVPWRIKNTIGRIKDKLDNFCSVEFSFIKKDANSMAHSLAANAVASHLSNQWWSSPPSCTAHLFSEHSQSCL
ncbi:uncharacterized protein LOC113290733 [Papaver somniferum]|uniref:uncharacterized protein LOC113290733 n=1 Tax=Papaver somniferum TaxID=3469 RepID=UPI000E6F4E79|nr:uncharacterized protein LOC113290733 [Papaver somniferum]